MSLKDMKLEDLELLSYTDLTYRLLKENGKSMTTANIFKKICELLEYGDSAFESNIGDFYTSLTIDKRFVLLDNNEWDLREKSPIEIVIDDEDEIDDEEENEDIEEEVYTDEDSMDNIDEDDIEEVLEDDDLDDVDDDLDLTIIDENQLKNEM